jgi:hypothetical protein
MELWSARDLGKNNFFKKRILVFLRALFFGFWEMQVTIFWREVSVSVESGVDPLHPL